jgi:spore germination protein GerM
LALLVVMVTALLAIVNGCSSVTSKLQSLGNSPVTTQSATGLPNEGLSNPLPQVAKAKVTVYFEDQQGRYLKPATVEVDKAQGIAKEAVDALCQGPAADIGASASLPAGTQVQSINIKTDGTCVVDLTGSVANAKFTPRQEAMAVDALVDTLTEFPAVKQVQILVNGGVQDTLAGHIPIDQPLLRNLTFVKGS